MRKHTGDLGHDFHPRDEELRRCVLKLLSVHVADRPTRLCSSYGLSQLVRRDRGTGLQVADGLRVGLQTGSSFRISICTAVSIAALRSLQGFL